MVYKKISIRATLSTLLCLVPLCLMATSIQVSWKANTEPDLSGYLVYVGNASGTYTSCTDVGKATSYRISNVTQGKTYYIALTAYDTSGNESGYSQEVSAYVPVSTTLAPDTTPTIQLVSPNAGSVLSSLPLLRWSAQSVRQFTLYLAINNAAYHKIYTGTNTSYYLPLSLWYMFIPPGATLTWYVKGVGSNGRQVCSVVSSFKKK